MLRFVLDPDKGWIVDDSMTEFDEDSSLHQSQELEDTDLSDEEDSRRES